MTDLWQLAFVLLVLLILLEAFAILALARAIGLIELRLSRRSAAQTSEGLPIGHLAPTVSGYEPALARRVTLDLTNGAAWTLVFVTPTCGTCRSLAASLGSLPDDVGFAAEIVLISRGGNEQNKLLRRLSGRFSLISDASGETHRAFDVETVRATSPRADAASLQASLDAADRAVPLLAPLWSDAESPRVRSGFSLCSGSSHAH